MIISQRTFSTNNYLFVHRCIIIIIIIIIITLFTTLDRKYIISSYLEEYLRIYLEMCLCIFHKKLLTALYDVKSGGGGGGGGGRDTDVVKKEDKSTNEHTLRKNVLHA